MSEREAERLEAAQWFLDIVDTEDPAPEMLQEWMRWMEASASNRRAFADVESAWQQIPSARGPRGVEPVSLERRGDDAYDGSISVAAWLTQRRGGTAAAAPPARRMTPAWRRKPLWLAAAATAAVIAMTLQFLPLLRSGASPESFTTDAGQQMQITLPDGSQVALGARSRLRVAYTPTSRNLRLERGEAFFSVQKNPTRPFRVHVLNDVVTAVGTQFDVRAINDRIDVAVADGVVQVNPDTVGHVAARITRGESLSFLSHRGERTLTSPVVTHIDPQSAARWRAGWLIYQDEPLRDVLADVARYSNRRIVVADPSAITRHFTGAVYKDSIVEWLRSLPNGFPVSVTQSGSNFMVAPERASAVPPP